MQNCPEMADDFEVPEYFREDYFAILGDERPDYRWLIIGPARSGSTFHKVHTCHLSGMLRRKFF